MSEINESIPSYPVFPVKRLGKVKNIKDLIPISFQPDGVNLLCFKLRLFDLIEHIVSFLRPMTH